MSDSSNGSGSFGNMGLVELTGKVAMVAIICFCCIAMFVFSLHIYSKWFLDNDTITTTRRRRRRLDFAAGHHQEIVTPLYPGLDPLLLKKLPVIIYDPKESEEELECAVCLCEVFEGEKARLLPKCNHGFHVDCIDMWFQSHSTCPICRNPVGDQNQPNPADESTFESDSVEETNIPANVLFWGDENHVSNDDEGHRDRVSEEPSPSMSNQPQGILVIDIPRQMDKEDEQKSPVPSRLRSLRRLLSSGSRNSSPSTPRNLDLEHGEVVEC